MFECIQEKRLRRVPNLCSLDSSSFLYLSVPLPCRLICRRSRRYSSHHAPRRQSPRHRRSKSRRRLHQPRLHDYITPTVFVPPGYHISSPPSVCYRHCRPPLRRYGICPPKPLRSVPDRAQSHSTLDLRPGHEEGLPTPTLPPQYGDIVLSLALRFPPGRLHEPSPVFRATSMQEEQLPHKYADLLVRCVQTGVQP